MLSLMKPSTFALTVICFVHNAIHIGLCQQSPVATFTSCSATGRFGPTQTQCDIVYKETFLESTKVVNGVQHFTIPFPGVFRIQAAGASGSGPNGGKGAFASGEFALPEGTQLRILVGQQGEGDAGTGSFGGSGASYVVRHEQSPLLVAGGGGIYSKESNSNIADGQVSLIPLRSSEGTSGGSLGLGGISSADLLGGGGAGYEALGASQIPDGLGEVPGLVPAQPFLLPGMPTGDLDAGNGGVYNVTQADGFAGGFGGGGHAVGGGCGAGGGYSGGAGASAGETSSGGSSYNTGMNPIIESNHTGPGKATLQYIDNGFDTRCSEEGFIVSFYREFVFGASNFTLHDPECKSESNNTHVIISSQLHGCGTSVSFEDDKVKFHNVIRSANTQSGDAIRHTINDIPVVCEFALKDAATINLLPSISVIRFRDQDTTSNGNFTITMLGYPTSRYVRPYNENDFPLQLKTNERLFIEVFLSAGRAIDGFELAIDNCFASPSSDRLADTSIRHQMIEKGCVNDETLEFVPSPDDVTKRFFFSAFSFVPANFSSIYIHCEAILCNSSNSASLCRKGCERQKRNADIGLIDALEEGSGESNRINNTELDEAAFGSLGPIMVLEKPAEDPDDSTSSNNLAIIIPSAVAGALFVALTLIVSYVIYIKRISVTKTSTRYA